MHRQKIPVAILRDAPAPVVTAEEIVQDSFAATHSAWPKLASSGRALSGLRGAVINRCRLAIRHRLVADKIAPAIASGTHGAQPQVAAAMGITTTAVRKHITRAMSALPAELAKATGPHDSIA
jgi:hypothetical protein